MKMFGTRLKGLRESKGLTQSYLGIVLKVSGNTISCWENNKQEPDLGTVLAISIYFDVSTDYLLGKTDY